MKKVTNVNESMCNTSTVSDTVPIENADWCQILCQYGMKIGVRYCANTAFGIGVRYCVNTVCNIGVR